MAGSLLDDLLEVFSDDETSNNKQVVVDGMDSPFVDAEDYLRRAVHMTVPQQHVEAPSSTEIHNSSMGPEDAADYYRRMVQMAEIVHTARYEGMGHIAPDSDNVAKTIHICTEFQKAGRCKAGAHCGFVHDGAFRQGACEGFVTVDPVHLLTHALQMPGGWRRTNSRPAVPQDLYLGDW